MTAVHNKGYGPISAISREQGDAIYDRVCELKNQAAETVKEKIRQLNKNVNTWELTALLTEGYQDFASKVHQEYDSTSHADIARMLISSNKIYFFSNQGLHQELSQITGKAT